MNTSKSLIKTGLMVSALCFGLAFAPSSEAARHYVQVYHTRTCHAGHCHYHFYRHTETYRHGHLVGHSTKVINRNYHR